MALKVARGLALLLGLVAASSCGNPQSTARQPKQSLIGTRWVVTHLRGEPLFLATATRPATLEFGSDGKLGGFSGCNDYGGRFRIRDDKLVLPGGIESNAVGCVGEAEAVEEALFSSLDEAFGFDQNGALIFGDPARPILRLRKNKGGARATS